MQMIKSSSYQEMSRQSANLLSAQVILKPNAVLGLATGSTPLGLYSQLVEWHRKGDLDFSQVHTVNLDEYCGLPPDNDQSYHFYMRHALFTQVNLKPENTHLPDGNAADLDAACAAYDQKIAALGGIDLQLLGLGLNGHIGFNEPSDAFAKGTHVVTLSESTRQANARFFPSLADVPHRAITMGLQSIMLARKIVLVVFGRQKQEILERVLYGPVTPSVPGSILQLHPNLSVVCCVE